MNRRTVLRTLASLPFLGWMAPKAAAESLPLKSRQYTIQDISRMTGIPLVNFVSLGRVVRREGDLYGVELLHSTSLTGKLERLHWAIHWVKPFGQDRCKKKFDIRIGALVGLRNGEIWIWAE